MSDEAACFVPDEEAAARLTVSLLTARGHRRIAHITGPVNDDLARDLRITGFQPGLADAGNTNGRVVEAASTDSWSLSVAGERVVLGIWAGDDRPTAIFAYTDLMAVGIYRADHQLGISIPSELSIVGFDDQKYVASEWSPGLTTMALPHYEMGRQATQALLIVITTGHEPVADVTLLPCPVPERISVAEVY